MTASAKPQDHKPKAGAPRRVTIMGVNLTVEPDVFDDIEMVEFLYDIQNAGDDASGAMEIIPFLRKLCGGSWGGVKRALRDPDTGRIPIERVMGFMQELMEKVAPNS